MESWIFERELKKLKKIFHRQVKPSLSRHEYFISRGERKRLKRLKAIKRRKKMQGGG